MRTDEELLLHILALRSNVVMFDFESPDLIGYLSFEQAKQFFRTDAGVTPETWIQYPRDTDSVRKELIDYLGFAWEKCRNERGLSAMRSIQHFRAWTWILGDAEAYAFICDDANYAPYGRPMLEYLTIRYTKEP